MPVGRVKVRKERGGEDRCEKKYGNQSNGIKMFGRGPSKQIKATREQRRERKEKNATD